MNRFSRRLRLFVLAAFLLVAFGCAKPPPPQTFSPAPTPKGKGEVEDLRVLPQDLNAYLRP